VVWRWRGRKLCKRQGPNPSGRLAGGVAGCTLTWSNTDPGASRREPQQRDTHLAAARAEGGRSAAAGRARGAADGVEAAANGGG
jgi:hypothetical protein